MKMMKVFLFIIIIIIIMYLPHVIVGYIERVEISGCESCQLKLTCRHFEAIIAIVDVNFKVNNSIFDTGFLKNFPNRGFPPDHPREALNKRCSGLNYCSFIFIEDSPGAEAWGTGNLTIRYACITQDRIHKYCNSDIQLNEQITSGFLHNPGYPRFYAGQKRCVWKITAPDTDLKVKVTILDIALSDGATSLVNIKHPDRLEIIDSNQIIFSTYKPSHPPDQIISSSHSIDVVLLSHHIINPRRGVLLYYEIIGCSTPAPPENGYLISRNFSLATYSCRNKLVFPDTQTTIQVIKCIGTNWNISLPLLNCETPKKFVTINLRNTIMEITGLMSELVIPIVLVICLFAVNGMILLYIFKARHRQPIIEHTDEEDLTRF